jgi:hypothetical protein
MARNLESSLQSTETGYSQLSAAARPHVRRKSFPNNELGICEVGESLSGFQFTRADRLMQWQSTGRALPAGFRSGVTVSLSVFKGDHVHGSLLASFSLTVAAIRTTGSVESPVRGNMHKASSRRRMIRRKSVARSCGCETSRSIYNSIVDMCSCGRKLGNRSPQQPIDAPEQSVNRFHIATNKS